MSDWKLSLAASFEENEAALLAFAEASRDPRWTRAADELRIRRGPRGKDDEALVRQVLNIFDRNEGRLSIAGAALRVARRRTPYGDPTATVESVAHRLAKKAMRERGHTARNSDASKTSGREQVSPALEAKPHVRPSAVLEGG